MALLEIVLTGTESVAAQIREQVATVPPLVGWALHDEALAIMKESKDRYVPVDLGTLKNSGQVAQPERTRDNVSVEMGYGGAASAYALAVHEHLSPSSPPSWQIAEANGHPVQWHKAGTGPKYLERPFLERAKGLAERVAAKVSGWMGVGRAA
jgi:hypothetical protein